jgi:hypothetical protein
MKNPSNGYDIYGHAPQAREKELEFPEFLENTVVPERKFLERWGTHRG